MTKLALRSKSTMQIDEAQVLQLASACLVWRSRLLTAEWLWSE
jgi:hypothetical protein